MQYSAEMIRHDSNGFGNYLLPRYWLVWIDQLVFGNRQPNSLSAAGKYSGDLYFGANGKLNSYRAEISQNQTKMARLQMLG